MVYLDYYTLNLMPLLVYRKVLFGVDIHRYIQCLASGATSAFPNRLSRPSSLHLQCISCPLLAST